MKRRAPVLREATTMSDSLRQLSPGPAGWLSVRAGAREGSRRRGRFASSRSWPLTAALVLVMVAGLIGVGPGSAAPLRSLMFAPFVPYAARSGPVGIASRDLN